jgi:hypothetical protein
MALDLQYVPHGHGVPIDLSLLTSTKVVLFTPGEAGAAQYTGYLTNLTMIGQYAQQSGAATILLERRLACWTDRYLREIYLTVG